MGFVRRVISSALDIANLAKHNANFADIETDLTEHRGRIAVAETELTAQGDRIDNIVASSGESNLEIVDAREDFGTLRERLDAEKSAVSAQLADITLNVRSFGAVADGITDDTEASQLGVDTLIALGGGTLLFPYSDNPYIVTNIKIHDANNITLKAQPGVILKIKDGSAYGGDNVATNIDILRSNNIKIEDLILDGNRENLNYSVPGYTGDGTSHGITIDVADNIHISNVISKNNGTDGLATRFFVSNLYIDRCVFTNSRRNTMSITREMDGLYVSESEFSSANGTAPQCGVDIEPTSGDRVQQNMFFTKCRFKDNVASGVAIDVRLGNKIINLNFKDCIFSGNVFSDLSFPLRDTATSENVNIENCTFESNVTITNPTNAAVKHKNLSIRDCYTKGSITLTSVDGGLIDNTTFDRSSGGEEILLEKDLNNITISKCTLKSIASSGIRRITEGAKITNLKIIDTEIYNKTLLRPILLNAPLNGIEGLLINRNNIHDNAETAIHLTNVLNGRVSENQIHNNSSGLRLEASSGVLVENNNFYNQTTSNIHASTSWTGNTVRNNSGIVTEAGGTATVLSGTTYIVVTVPNSIALRIQDLSVTPSTSLGTATRFWVSNVGANAFRITVDAAPGANIDFSWKYTRL